MEVFLWPFQISMNGTQPEQHADQQTSRRLVVHLTNLPHVDLLINRQRAAPRTSLLLAVHLTNRQLAAPQTNLPHVVQQTSRRLAAPLISPRHAVQRISLPHAELRINNRIYHEDGKPPEGRSLLSGGFLRELRAVRRSTETDALGACSRKHLFLERCIARQRDMSMERSGMRIAPLK